LKKFLALAFSALLVLGLAGSAFAIHAEIPAETQAVVAKGSTQITLGGMMKFEGYYKNNADFDDDAADHDTKYRGLARLTVKANVADNVTGLITVDAGGGRTSSYWTWGEADGAKGFYGKGNGKRAELNINQAWINYTLGPAGLKVGHMPLALGNKLFFDHTKYGDDAIVVYADPADGLHIGALTAKFQENSTTNADDANAYVILGVYKHEMFGVSGDITHVDDNSIFGGLSFFNIGMRGNMNAGPVALKADLEFQTGSVDDVVGEDGMDFSGMAALVSGAATLGPVDLDLEIGYGTGEDGTTDDEHELFVTSLNPDSYYFAQVYDRVVAGASGSVGHGIENTTYVKLGCGAKITDAIGLTGDIVYLMASEDVTNGEGDESDDAGIEIDATFAYKFAKNLTYSIEAGYLLAGDIYTTADGSNDDAYILRHDLKLSF
jgi:hypothetical protein